MAVIELLKRNWLIVSIVILGAFLRTWKLNTLGILFSDAGRDLLAAQSAVLSGEIPLLGIPSSVPRFHQGPLTIWLHMVIYLVAGNRTLAYSLVFALLSILALIFTYEFAVVHINKPTALVAATILAVSPLAVAHARVPYHITPIPLVVLVFLFALMRLWQKHKMALFWALLSWTLLMQFELALFGLFLLIAYVLWKRKYTINRQHIAEVCAAGMLGFVPQIVYDLRHPFSQSQLFAFFAWVGYRLISLTGLTGKHQFSAGAFSNALGAFATYGQRIFSTDLWIVTLVVLVSLVVTVVIIVKQWRQRKLPTAVELISLTVLVLTISYLAHGGPSEAYFPPYTVLLSLLLGYGLTEMFKRNYRGLATILGCYVLLTVISIFRYNFFVSNHLAFNYGPSLAEQRGIITTIDRLSNHHFYLRSTDEGRKFPSYLDNYFWLNREQHYLMDPRGTQFFINLKDSALRGYPGMSTIEFPTRDVYQY